MLFKMYRCRICKITIINYDDVEFKDLYCECRFRIPGTWDKVIE